MSDFSPRFLADYAVPTFNIETVDLVFDLDDTKTKVISTLVMTRQGIHKEALILNGEHLTLLSISIDEEILPSNSSAAVKSPARSSAKSKSILGRSGKFKVSSPNPKSSISCTTSSGIGSSGTGRLTTSGSPE